MTKYSKGEWTNARYDICEIECDGEVYCTVATKDVDLIIDVLNENEQLKQSVNNLKDTIIKITIAYQRKYDRTIVDLVDEVHEEDITDLIKELKE